jgi:hypothetical protein
LGLGDLPEIASEWNDLADGERASLSLDWDHLMASYLMLLNQAFRNDQLPPEARLRFEQLLVRLERAAPLIEQLHFYPPSIALSYELPRP